jgi:putative transposase
MPRRPRLKLADVPFHIIQRGINRTACFYADVDYEFYLRQLQRLCQAQGVFLHAYVLMTNHVHLLLTPQTADGPSQLMKHLGQRYVQYVNRTYQRSGTLWEGRFRSCLVDAESYLLGCQRYIELNPVRAQIVSHPADYRWSSYRAHAQGEGSSLLSPHPCYLGLGRDDAERQANYRALFRERLEPGWLDAIRQATNGGYCLGNERFKQEVTAVLGRRVERGKPGRPQKKDSEDSQQVLLF